MGPVRGEIMWQAVLDAVAVAGPEPLDVLDVGGGTGGDAVRLAAGGHRVTVVDPSPDALAALDRRAAESRRVEGGGGVDEGGLTGVLGDTDDLADVLPEASFDLVLCHGVLEHVDDVDAAVRAVVRATRASGYVSLVVAGRHAATIRRAVAGDFAGALSLATADVESWSVRERGPRRFVPAELARLLDRHGLRPRVLQGVRTFADLVPSSLVDVSTAAREELFALERIVRQSPDFVAVSGGLHAIACLDLA